MTTPPPGQWPPPPPPQGPPPWGPPQVPQSRGGATKWILGGVGIFAVVVVSVAATLFVTRNNSEPDLPADPETSGVADLYDVASASDRGAAEIVTEDPTCASWTPIVSTLSDALGNGWNKRDPTIPRADWTPTQRDQYEGAASAMITAAEETAELVKITPHRIMRELYEQSIAYWRSYAESIANYDPKSDHLALASNGFSSTITWVCSAITYGSAAARAPLVLDGITPLTVAPVADPSDPQMFLTKEIPACKDWADMVLKYRAETERWLSTADPNIPATQWSPEQQALFTSVVSIISGNANEVQNIGLLSSNNVFRDFADFAAQYRRAYVQSIATYTPADNYLDSAASELILAIEEACKATVV